jgi:hypothetical protein
VGFKGKDASEEERKVLITSDHVSLDRWLAGLAVGVAVPKAILLMPAFALL